MPSFTIAGWGRWQAITGYPTAPWLVEDGAQNIVHWSVQMREVISSFVASFFAAPASKKLRVTQRKSDAHVEGRTAWTSFVSANWKSVWKAQDIIDATLKEQSCGPYKAMGRRKSRNLPTLERAQVHKAYPFLAYALFGEDSAANATATFLKDNVQDFLERIMACMWNRYWKNLNRERVKMVELQATVKTSWLARIRHYLASSDKLITLLKRYNDPESVKQIKDQRQQICTMIF
ncbi:hypothetical protein SERLA73DRAFT_155416 [Serpula lacrymans var. lacrymans S7.3]|uniref:Uncharacterized protein n=2 Tax=Serpula lacrymans var. lacrymans TaxID=341189 RepID=F8QA32_SERL3|nr:uncharacterized protein SERLADRAFT_411074 [Serpula lacrymans var. lacrymans S7.9]EGN94622.1 hypothetical protein SERLA73DRAFT_155416 [Serpula lacrymans var. lacrymans S7.3]EGO20102.1 hypothetical protein SERLADRAFT_411074 [Serpula lacrymans var. lacrymans S7.9]